MPKIQESVTSIELAGKIIQGILEKKGKDIVQLDLRDVDGAVSDFFIICHGDSHRQVDAIADAIREEVLKLGQKPWQEEGLEHKNWVLMDFVDVVVHVFHRETRGYYSVEDLWGDATVQHIKSA